MVFILGIVVGFIVGGALGYYVGRNFDKFSKSQF